jgi:hypothetical protein
MPLSFVDLHDWPEMVGRKVRIVDVELEPLPYADKSVDFLYCRHTIEDMSCPFLLLSEIRRVAKAGYIETPSPLAEFTRGVNRGMIRGYVHHRWFVWAASNQLTLLPKFPLIEYADTLNAEEEQRISQLNESPQLWNTYFPWRGSFTFTALRHPGDFNLAETYGHVIGQGIAAGMENSKSFLSEFELAGAVFYGTIADQQQ